MALGAHGNTLNEVVQGDMGWTSPESCEAESKIVFDERLLAMEQTRWAGKIYQVMYMRSMNMRWTPRLRYLEKGDDMGRRVEASKMVRESERQIWESGMKVKSALGSCREWKTGIVR